MAKRFKFNPVTSKLDYIEIGNLQMVTDVGNKTTNDIILTDGATSTLTFARNPGIGSGVIQYENLTGNFKLNNDSIQFVDGANSFSIDSGSITCINNTTNSLIEINGSVIRQRNGTNNTEIYNVNVTADRSYYLPNADGTFAFSVNGVFADVNGNIASNETNTYIFDDFLNTNTSSLNIGQLGWSHTPSAGGSSVSFGTSVPNHAGVLSIISPTSGAGTSILHLANSATVGNTAYGNVKDFTVVFNMPVIVGSGFFIGMSQNWTIAPANTMYIRKLSTDTNFQFVNVAGGVSTVTNSGIAPVAGTWYKFKIVPSATNIQYWLNGALIATVATNIMASTVMLGAGSLHTGGNRQLLIDCVGINLNQVR